MSEQTALVEGALLRWPTGPGSPTGVVRAVDNQQVTVLLDGEDEPKRFSTRAGAVERVVLTGMVKRQSTGDVGIVQGMTTQLPPRWQVFIDGRVLTVTEADLRPHVLNDPRSRLMEGRLGSARQFALAVTSRRYEIEQLTNDLVSLGQSRVALKPHQVSVVHRVVSDYPHRYLLCDEVGLGKTIKAGLVLKELRARGGATRCLVIVPPNLVRQWQFELKSKFNETFSVLNSDTVRFLKSAQGFDGNPFEALDSVIVSSGWIGGEPWSRLMAEVPWDMVIVDEAHHARVRVSGNKREETRLYRAVRNVVSPDAFSKRATLFLTATPMQLDSRELFSLVELLDPALFPTVQHFERHRQQVPGLSRLVHDLTSYGFPPPSEDPEELVSKVAGWLGQEADEVSVRLASGEEEVALLCEELTARHLLSQVLIRNRKKVIGGFMPRQAHRWEVELSLEELRALNAVEEYVREGFSRADRTHDQAVGFVMVIFQKLMASSIRALRVSLDRRRDRLEQAAAAPALRKRRAALVADLEEGLERDAFVAELLDEVAAADSQEAHELARLVELLDAVPTDSKADTLVRQLDSLKTLDGTAKVLLFTEFRETQEYLRQRLEATGWEVNLFHGQMKPEAKDGAVEAFRAATAPAILLSTEAGGEGRNFQFCHLLVNYDLPWNPMRVEQRIGRVDRIGQTDTVQVFNFWVKGTVEERVLDVLERRIGVFEQTVGGLDPILGDAERDLTKILRLGGEERDAALARYETLVERRMRDARAADEKLRDFIMETKSYSRLIAEQLVAGASPVTPADQERFVSRLLADVKTYLSRNADGTFDITFHEPFVSDYPQHCKERRTRTVALRPDVRPDSEHVEYLAMGHALVDDLVARVTASSYAGGASAFEVASVNGVQAGQGWLVVHELGVPGLKEAREVVTLFIRDDQYVDAAAGHALIDRAATFPNDVALSPADYPLDGLDDAIARAEEHCYARLHEVESAVRTDSERALDREREKMAAYFDYRDLAARDRLESSQQTLRQLEAADSADTRRIIPVWKANVARDERLIEQLAEERHNRLSALTRRAAGSGDLRLLALARVHIEDEGTTP
ncbi:MAG: SNF2-related protein [Actinomycetota bacterium]|nr:SNF2-related protein [Actinomycetota bacterium]